MSSVSDITALATLALGYKMLSGLGFLGFGGEETTDEKLGTGVAGAKYFRDSPLASGDPAETCDYDMKCDTRSDLKKWISGASGGWLYPTPYDTSHMSSSRPSAGYGMTSGHGSVVSTDPYGLSSGLSPGSRIVPELKIGESRKSGKYDIVRVF